MVIINTGIIYEGRPYRTNGSYFVVSLNDGKYAYAISSNSATIVYYSNTNIIYNSWAHLLVSRKDGYYKMYINGNLEFISPIIHSGTLNSSTDRPAFGYVAFPGAGWFKGYFGAIRITNGSCISPEQSMLNAPPE